jgi:hypothetical protein
LVERIDDTLWGYRGKNGDWYAVQLVEGGPFVRVPKLRSNADGHRQREVLQRVFELGGAGVSQRVGNGQARSGVSRVLRALMRKGLIELVGVSPARYRVTGLGRLALGHDRGLVLGGKLHGPMPEGSER